MKSARTTLFALTLLLNVPAVSAQIVDPIPTPIQPGSISIELDLIAGGMAAPNLLTHANDGSGRRFVVDQAGAVRVINADGSLRATPLLDLSGVLAGLNGAFDNAPNQGLGMNFDERGLLGLAFHPEFATPGALGQGLLYTYSSEPVTQAADFSTIQPGDPLNHQSVVTQWQIDAADPNVVDPISRRELLRVDQPQFNHNAGMIAFDPTSPRDELYIAFGDGGNADDLGGGHVPGGNGQDPSNVLGTLLRIDPLGSDSANGQYGIPVGNPFTSNANIPDEIFATGTRNPFRFSFDRLDGRLIIADVGQGNIEEVDIVQAGDNLGWAVKEGTFFFDQATGEVSAAPFPGQVDPGDLVDPVLQYDHDEGISVIGGFVYRGSAIPELVGKYVFGDFSQAFGTPAGRLFYGDLDTGQINELILGATPRDLGLFVKGFGEDEDGELYLLAGENLAPFGTDGKVFQIVPVPEPTAAGLLGLAGMILLRRRRD